MTVYDTAPPPAFGSGSRAGRYAAPPELAWHVRHPHWATFWMAIALIAVAGVLHVAVS